MVPIDLSFSRYVAARKSEAQARAREGAAYAYGGDLRVRSAIDKLRPVALALEASVRFWHAVGKNDLLARAVKVSERQFPKVHALVRRAADALQVPEPAVYVSPQIFTLEARTFGSSDEQFVLLGTPLIDQMSDDELLFVIGRECGQIQNGHTTYMTALHFLTTSGSMILRWGARPAVIALRGWARRAQITCDRAGLLCARSLDAAISALVKCNVGSKHLYSEIDVDEYLRELDATTRGHGRFGELLATNPYLPKRVEALRLFAETTYYRSVVQSGDPATGLSKDDCDVKVGALLAVLG